MSSCQTGRLPDVKTPHNMNYTETSPELCSSPTCIDLDYILRGLESLSNSMDQLALQTQLRQCDLIVCVNHPDKLGHLKVQEAPKQAPRASPGNHLETEG
ncbi:synaptonemal complex central element protein 3 isoform X2 [Phyllopteryx taeniolatus]|uniref:synaptonemal complex central element protein 3 isoform X2 n=1 Tax=Phyllopteryx taeniolatus TaxID=161469 RepID=UPI002AD4F04C|nr:synaptonemal complex central element protein 3 isoform X2 [Phyllopteryx taeniolatus]